MLERVFQSLAGNDAWREESSGWMQHSDVQNFSRWILRAQFYFDIH
jgi:hypothetical protein